MNEYRLIRSVPVEEAYDLLVAGGGPAGSAAAICAARLGAKVLLVEATGCLGGMGTSGLICAWSPMADGEKMLVGGFMRELVETQYERGLLRPGINPDTWRKNFCGWTHFNPEGLKAVLDERAVAAGVEVRFFTKLIDADADPAAVRQDQGNACNDKPIQLPAADVAVIGGGTAVRLGIRQADGREQWSTPVADATWTRVVLDFTPEVGGSLAVLVAKTDGGIAFCDNLGLPRQPESL